MLDQPVRKFLVFGGSGSVGREVVKKAFAGDYQVHTAGLHESENHQCDMENVAEVVGVFREHGPFDHVVVASGINLQGNINALKLHSNMREQMAVNAFGPMIALQAWLRQWGNEPFSLMHKPGHFVVVGSNSAYIPRTGSIGYCMSKAALNMGIRCAAREVATRDGGWPGTIWCLDPGWIQDSEMSKEVYRRLPAGTDAHRIPGGRALKAEDVADFIFYAIWQDARHFNGTTMRLDGGEI